MQESDVRTMLEATAAVSAPPSAVDLHRAMRDGRRTRATRRAVLAGATALGVSAAVGGTFAALRPMRSAKTPDPAATTPPARAWPPRPNGPLGGPTLERVPAQFDRLGQWAVFGWLPFEPATVTSGVMADYVSVTAHTDQSLRVSLFNRPEAAEDALRRGGTATTAPAVAGQPARWISPHDSGDEFAETLQWRCAPGNWAEVATFPVRAGHPMPTGSERREMLHRVASAVGLSATRRQRFPFRTAALPADLPLFAVILSTRADGSWEANIHSGQSSTIKQSALTIGVSKLSPDQSTDEPTAPADVDPSAISRAEVDGHRAYRMRTDSVDSLTVWLPDGLRVGLTAEGDSMRQLGADGVLGLYRGMEVLADPASWTDKPI